MNDEFVEFISHLTDDARTSLHHANIIAQGFGSSYIGTEHLLLGILAHGSSVGSKILADAGVTLDRAQTTLNIAPLTVIVTSEAKRLSEMAKLTLKLSWDIAQEYHQDFLGTEHILYGILSQKNSRASVLLRDMNIDVLSLSNDLEEFLNSQRDSINENFESATTTPVQKISRQKGALGLYGTDLTELAKSGKIDPVIGRSQIEDRVITVLSRRTKNNPVLIGDPGVGKTAIAEGIALRIANEDVPDYLLDKNLIQLDLAGMIAGTKYRGEFEDRLKRVIDEIKQRKNLIIFIDEIHLLVGAGAAEGSLDAANILKPALARGEIKLIGATTSDEYRKHIEKDTALERRLQTVIVPEPSLKETMAILQGLRYTYEIHHGVTISDEVIEDTIYMTERYVHERFMPDKAIDVLDEAAALVRVKNAKKPSRIRSYTKQLKNLNEKMEEAVSAEDYEKAAVYKTRVMQINEKLDNISKDKKSPVALISDDVAKAISMMTNIPVQNIQRSEAKLLQSLEKHLGKYVIGQPEAVSKVAKAIRRGRSGVSNSKRPTGSFIFMGPTGVGKTELAKVLAREVFGSENSLIKIDMSEFSEKHNTSRLLGAPAGYIGYDDGGKLTDKIRRQPYSVVLFDEIEKAHPEVFNLLLQILEDGILTDAKGKKVNFSNSIIILTSNLGSQKMISESNLGFHASTVNEKIKLEEVHKENAISAEAELNKIMRPELINRFDDIIVFRSLTRNQIGKIFDNMIEDLQNRILPKGFCIKVSQPAKRFLIKRGYNEKYGARPLRRVIQDEIERQIADIILSGRHKKGTLLLVNLRLVNLREKEVHLDIAHEE